MRPQNITAAVIFATLVMAPFLDSVTASFNGLGRESVNASQGMGRAEQVIEVEESVAQPEPAVISEPVALSVHHPVPVSLGDAQHSSPPDFSSYRSTLKKKIAFYDYLLPLVHKANEEVVFERQWLISMANRLAEGKTLSELQIDGLGRFEKRYLVHKPSKVVTQRVHELLQRVDVVPASLIIAQAAKESGWGTSRFATEGNNFFGIWCFYQGCGLTPKRRDSGRNHEVATFTTVEQGVRYYVRTINTHAAYNDLRRMRMDARRNEETLIGIDLANGLVRYSERGMAYVREVQSIIRVNKMQRFNKGYVALVSA